MIIEREPLQTRLYKERGDDEGDERPGKLQNLPNLNYYLISYAQKVYSLVGQGMWPSAFPEYAAKIGGVEFKRIHL